MNCRRARRPIARSSIAIAAAALLAVTPSPAAESAAEAPASADLRNEIAAYGRLAAQAADQEKWPLAEEFLKRLCDLPAPAQEKKSAFRELAERYEKAKSLSKAIAIYEKLLEHFPAEADTPELLLKLGLLYRESGAAKLAISRFYSVLNATLKINERKFEGYRDLTRRAQTEIADTYFQQGDYAQAAKFYGLVARLDLRGEDKGTIQFKLAHCRFRQGDMAGTIASAQEFLRDFAAHSSAPECRYLLASALRAERRTAEAYDAVLALMREAQKKKEKAPEKWSYWQRKTGNEFANDFYQQGEFLRALTIYQALAQLSAEPEWQWPVIYQMGLCFERLRLSARAAEAYKFILDEAKKSEGTKALPESVTGLIQMARWRGEQLAWNATVEAQVGHLLGPAVAPAAAPALPQTP